ncbi:MAG: DUF2442 domain-containing protein [Janthinobacterium lividum]
MSRSRNDTDYLLASPANAKHLLDAIGRSDAAHFSDDDIAAATESGVEMMRTTPRARAAHYDPAADRIVIDLTSGATYSFAPGLVQGLRGASAADLAEVEVLGRGFGLHWELLDVDYTVAGLLRGVFGTRTWMDRLQVADVANQ